MIDVNPTITIEDLKCLIFEHICVRPQFQRLIFQGAELKSTSTLIQCNVEEEAILLVIERRPIRFVRLIFDQLLAVVAVLGQALAGLEVVEDDLDEHVFLLAPAHP